MVGVYPIDKLSFVGFSYTFNIILISNDLYML